MTHPAQGAPAPVVHLPHNVDLPIIFYQDQPVITFAMMDKAHRRPEGTAGRNFRTHRDKLIQSEDFYLLEQPDEIRRVGLARSDGSTPASVVLLTETGYLMLVKSFTDDLAWQVQRELVKNYFRKADEYETPSRSSDIRMRHSVARLDIELCSDRTFTVRTTAINEYNAADMLYAMARATIEIVSRTDLRRAAA